GPNFMSKTKKFRGSGARAFLYLRVSSGKQAAKELSVPDQRKQLRAYCEREGWEIANEYVETGSAFHGHRPIFDEMIEAANHGSERVDFIVVHSFSRFFRDAVEAELTLRSLEKRGTTLISITQDFGDDEGGQLVRRLLMLFDEHSSKETSKHVRRTMTENAKQGFWNGGPTPFGFRTYVAEQRGQTIKKKLEIAPDEADLVKIIFDLFLTGDGSSGPMGVKRITSWLNENGYRTRRGSKWSIKVVHQLLTSTTVKGEFVFGKTRDIDNTVTVSVPEIIKPYDFDIVQRMLKARDPKKTPPRDTTSDILLSKIACCGHCGSGMTIATGKGGRYRYYKCGGEMKKGKTFCPGMIVPMDPFDTLIIDEVSDKLFTKDRMQEMLAGLMERQAAKRLDNSGHLERVTSEFHEAEQGLKRIYGAIATGVLDSSDPTLQQHIADAKERKDFAQAARDRALAELAPETEITDKSIERFTDFVRERLKGGDTQFKRAYLRAVIDKIVVNENTIKIVGASSSRRHSNVRASAVH
ncbi:recombinase family protein, partial [Tropicibacter naphthalenivorans]|uniref:recombinase family protein n=1 Tax=Tropicibacter naphthalenivorans TaxID=441103 RepID=UPI0009D81D92